MFRMRREGEGVEEGVEARPRRGTGGRRRVEVNKGRSETRGILELIMQNLLKAMTRCLLLKESKPR